MDDAQFRDEALDASTHILAVSGELDLNSVDHLRRRIEAAFAGGPPQLVIDLSAVTHMDSTGLAELISAHQRAMELHGRLVLLVTSPPIRRTLEIRGVSSIFTIVDSRDGARAALATGS
jgi:anti-anti-sigma factor